jgi:glycosyltransferase involved in cell wall biosynthesis
MEDIDFRMPKPFLTVLIDTYNQETFIADAIRSVLLQDIDPSDMEILIVDDGSTDGTRDVVRQFEPKVRCISKSNGGQASAFNIGIAESKGEIVAFLDGDDWWAPGKLAALSDIFSSEPDVGMVGHGLTEVHPDGSVRVEFPQRASRFRITSVKEAKTFRLLRGFFGTSRMCYRRSVLARIGATPEALRFEADEYLFTLAPLFTEAVLLDKVYTFYRLHERNLYQVSHGGRAAVKRKQLIIATLASALNKKLIEENVAPDIRRALVECVELEAALLRLKLDSGFPWETILNELKVMRIFHADASLRQKLFSYLRLLPAVAMPAKTYYDLREGISKSGLYKNLRRKILPFPVPRIVKRVDKQKS